MTVDFANTETWNDETLKVIGKALQEARKVSTEGEVTFDAVDVVVGATRFTCNPRTVTVDEVAACSKSSCGTCRGDGKRHLTQKKKGYTREIIITCGCAEKRFKKQHKNMLIDIVLDEWVIMDDITVSDVVEENDAD